MKQLIIGKNVAYASSADANDLTSIEDGAIAIINLSTGKVVTAANQLTNNFCVASGRGDNKQPICFSEVDVKSLTVVKAEYEEGTKFTATITVPTTEKNSEYTVIISKKGTVFNERSNWSFTARAKSDVAADVATELVKAINANKYNLGVEAEATGGAIKITAVEEGKDYNVIGADGLMGVELTDVTEGKVAILDKAYVQDLASRCAAGKGFNYLGEDGKDLYSGYPEPVDADKYVLYTLRFAVPRIAAKQRDEVVYQILHIAVPEDAASVSTLDSIFGTSSASAASLSDDETNASLKITPQV